MLKLKGEVQTTLYDWTELCLEIFILRIDTYEDKDEGLRTYMKEKFGGKKSWRKKYEAKKRLGENEYFSFVWNEEKIQEFEWEIWILMNYLNHVVISYNQCEVGGGWAFSLNISHNFMRKILWLVSNNFFI